MTAEIQNKMDHILSNYPKGKKSLIPVLQEISKEFNFLPCEALEYTSKRLEIPMSQIFSVATFYKAFSLKPKGKTIIRICMGTACHVKGASTLYQQVAELLNIKDKQTTPDGRFTLEIVNCVGMCAMAPVALINKKVHGKTKFSDLKKAIVAKGDQ